MIREAKIDELTLDENNANVGTERGAEMLDESLREYGAGRSILVDKHGKVIAGNKTLSTASDIGLDDVVIVQTDGSKLIAVQRTDLDLETDPKARLLAFADNRIAEVNLEWSVEQLEVDIDAGLDISGLWEDFELDELIGKQEPVKDPGAQVDKAEELQEKWQVERGQIWEIPSKSVAGKSHRVMCGDSTCEGDVGRLMDGEKAQAIVTDPPYGIKHDLDYTRFTGGVYGTRHKTKGILEGDDRPFDPMPYLDFPSVVIWGANYCIGSLPIGTWLVWDKRFKDGQAFLSDAELAWVKGGHGVYIFSLTSQGFVRPEKVQHPTQKPVELLVWCMEKGKVTGLVYDPFLGSGTTMVAAEKLSRRCFGMEISPRYCSVTLERLQDMGLEPILT